MALYKLSEKQLTQIANKKLNQQKKTLTKVKVKLPSKGVDVYTTKKQAALIAKNQKRYDAALKKRATLKAQTDNKIRKGKTLTVKEKKALQAANKAVKKENSLLHNKLNSLSSKDISESITYRTNGKRYQKKVTRAGNGDSILRQNEEAFVRVRLLTPYAADSGGEYSINDFLTIVLLKQDKKTVYELLEMQLSPFKKDEDFVVHQIMLNTTKKY